MLDVAPVLTAGGSNRAIGQMLIMGWDGTEVTPQIRHLIEDHHIGSILLTAKNLKCAVAPEPTRFCRQEHT
jgi:hypothetical protein